METLTICKRALRALSHPLCAPGQGVRSTPHTLHSTPYNPHPTPHSLHSKPHTLHSTPYTLALSSLYLRLQIWRAWALFRAKVDAFVPRTRDHHLKFQIPNPEPHALIRTPEILNSNVNPKPSDPSTPAPTPRFGGFSPPAPESPHPPPTPTPPYHHFDPHSPSFPQASDASAGGALLHPHHHYMPHSQFPPQASEAPRPPSVSVNPGLETHTPYCGSDPRT